jgi:hypothetical protein
MEVGRRLVVQGSFRQEGDTRFVLRGSRQHVVGDPIAVLPCDVLTARSFRLGRDEFSIQSVQTVDSCGFPSGGAFDIRVDDEQCLVEVRVRVRLIPLADPVDETSWVWDVVGFLTPGLTKLFYEGSKGCVDERRVATAAAVLERREDWRSSIRRHWSRKHRIRALGLGCPCPAYDVDIDVIWVDDPAERVHAQIDVASGCGRADEGRLFIGNRAAIAAHEFGHWIGLDDEYPGTDRCPVVTVTNSIMWAPNFPFFNNARVFPFHYHFFAEWLSSRKCCEFEIGRIEDIGRFESFD